MKHLKLIFAIALLLCLLPMPYGYFMLVRFLALIFFSFLAVGYYGEKKEGLALTFGILAVVFQPFFKIALGRTVWNLADVVVAILLIVLWLKESKS